MLLYFPLEVYRGEYNIMFFLKIVKKEIKYKIRFAIIYYVVYAILFYFSKAAVSSNEMILLVIALIPASMIWGDEQDMDIISITSFGLKNLMIARFIAIVLTLCFFPGLHIYIFSPKEIRVNFMLIYTVTILFMSAVAVLIRTLVNNSLGAMIVSLSFSIFLIFPTFILKEIGDKIRSSYFYPLYSFNISNQFQFIKNRIIVCIMSIFIILITYLILWFKEKRISKIN